MKKTVAPLQEAGCIDCIMDLNLTDNYLVVLGGAIAMTEIYHDIWPTVHGVKLIRRLIDKG